MADMPSARRGSIQAQGADGGSAAAAAGGSNDGLFATPYDQTPDPKQGILLRLASQMPRTAISHTFTMTIAQNGVAQVCPPLIVEPGLNVALRGANTNTGVIRVGRTPEDLAGIGGRRITPDTEIAFSCDHTGQIWIVGTAGDQMIVAISGAPIS